MKRRSFLFVVLLVSMLLTLTVVANAETMVTTYEDMYVGEYVSEAHEGFAHIIFGQVSDSSDEYGIIVEDQNGAKKLFKGRHIGVEGKFGIALYGVPCGEYSVYAYVGDKDRVYGNVVSFAVEPDWESIFEYSSGVITGLTEYGKTLTKIKIPDKIDGVDVVTIGYDALSENNLIESVIIGNNVKNIESHAFWGCTSLKSVVIGNSVEEIGGQAFHNCTSLESIEIPDSVTGIGDWAFAECTSLESVNIGKSVTSIGGYAFAGGYSLTNIVIPDGVESIGYNVFESCCGLETITIPDSVTHIDVQAFNNCSSLKKVNYLGTIDEWVRINFFDYDWETSYSSNPLSNGANLYINDVLQTDITISVESINRGAFYNYDSLRSVTIGSSVKSMGDYAFYSCNSLEKVNYLGTLDQWSNIEFESKDNAFEFRNSYANPLCNDADFYINNILQTDITINSETINSYAFYFCTTIKSLTIGNNVKSIGYGAFWGCGNIENLKYNAIECADLSYDNCVFLGVGESTTGAKIIIGEDVKRISACLFYPNRFSFEYWLKIESITFEGTISQWEAIIKGNDWKDNISATYVQCTDGQVSL